MGVEMAEWYPSWILCQAPRPGLWVSGQGEGVRVFIAPHAASEGMYPDPSMNPEAITNLNRGFGRHLLALVECQVTGKV